MAQARWLPAAQKDLFDITYRIGTVEAMPDTAERIAREIQSHCELCATFPLMGQAYPELGENYRGFTHRRWLVVYRPTADGIEVGAVIDSAREFVEFFRNRLP